MAKKTNSKTAHEVTDDDFDDAFRKAVLLETERALQDEGRSLSNLDDAEINDFIESNRPVILDRALARELERKRLERVVVEDYTAAKAGNEIGTPFSLAAPWRTTAPKKPDNDPLRWPEQDEWALAALKYTSLEEICKLALGAATKAAGISPLEMSKLLALAYRNVLASVIYGCQALLPNILHFEILRIVKGDVWLKQYLGEIGEDLSLGEIKASNKKSLESIVAIPREEFALFSRIKTGRGKSWWTEDLSRQVEFATWFEEIYPTWRKIRRARTQLAKQVGEEKLVEALLSTKWVQSLPGAEEFAPGGRLRAILEQASKKSIAPLTVKSFAFRHAAVLIGAPADECVMSDSSYSGFLREVERFRKSSN